MCVSINTHSWCWDAGIKISCSNMNGGVWAVILQNVQREKKKNVQILTQGNRPWSWTKEKNNEKIISTMLFGASKKVAGSHKTFFKMPQLSVKIKMYVISILEKVF